VSVPLPSLPPLGGQTNWLPAGRSAIDILGDQHRQIGALCAELTGSHTSARRRREVRDVLTATVAGHLAAEEQYLYPAVRSALPGGGQVADQEIAADQALLRTLQQLGRADTAEASFTRLAGTVAGQLRRHAEIAERRLFPRLREVATEQELVRLGNRVTVAQEAAPTRPHPATPATPPWNKVVDPSIGVLDRVRDAVSGRRTHPDQLNPGESKLY
jgi:hemerythrin superfamily protein